MENPFAITYTDTEDTQLIEKALNGSKEALEALVKKHQHYIYNIALRMTLSPFDAEDVTQEVLVKMITRLDSFKGKSSFRTWLYRITVNHFLKMRKMWLEEHITTFDAYGEELDQMKNEEMTHAEQLEMKEYVEEAKLGCMSGMLLCLSREQRMVYILGEIFGIDHTLGAELLETSKDNFRQRLSRARKDLYQFMNNKCGLVNKKNPCRCTRKTQAFIKEGWVDKKQMKFNTAYLKKIAEVVPNKSDDLCEITDHQYADLFKEHPFQEKVHHTKLFKNILNDGKIKSLFNLN